MSTLAVLDTGATLDILSKFSLRLTLDPYLEYNKFFGTAVQSSIKAMGAYLSLPLWFGSKISTTPTIRLKASGHNNLKGSSFFNKYQTIIDNYEGKFLLDNIKNFTPETR